MLYIGRRAIMTDLVSFIKTKFTKDVENIQCYDRLSLEEWGRALSIALLLLFVILVESVKC